MPATSPLGPGVTCGSLEGTATVGAGHAPAARTVAIASRASNPSTVAQAVVLDADALRPPERAGRRFPAPRVARLPPALRRDRDLRRSAAAGGRARRADRETDRPHCPLPPPARTLAA